ncbi:MAG: CoA transferase [Desulfobacteraceae bacterium]
MKKRALTGIRVIDLTWVWSGPMLSEFLADMGAEVIKVEHWTRLDASRFTGRFTGKASKEKTVVEKSGSFHELNRNKLGITLDLAKPKGVDLFNEIIKKSDLMVENFSFGVAEKLGIDYESLSKVKPDIIYLSMPAAGRSGPLRDIIGYAPVYTSLAGLESLSGYEDGTTLGMLTFGPGDANAAIHGVIAALAALRHHKRTGEGQFIELSQTESICHLIGEPLMEYFMNDRVMGPQGNRHVMLFPHGIYPCKGDDKWVSIAVDTEEDWKNFCRALGSPDWIKDKRYSNKFERMRNCEPLDKSISQWTRNYTDYQATEILQSNGVAAAPVLTRIEKSKDPQFKERRVFKKMIHPVVGEEFLEEIPMKLSDTPAEIYRNAPLVGEHNDYVYGELLGMSKEQIAVLEEEKVIF